MKIPRLKNILNYQIIAINILIKNGDNSSESKTQVCNKEIVMDATFLVFGAKGKVEIKSLNRINKQMKRSDRGDHENIFD